MQSHVVAHQYWHNSHDSLASRWTHTTGVERTTVYRWASHVLAHMVLQHHMLVHDDTVQSYFASYMLFHMNISMP